MLLREKPRKNQDFLIEIPAKIPAKPIGIIYHYRERIWTSGILLPKETFGKEKSPITY